MNIIKCENIPGAVIVINSQSPHIELADLMAKEAMPGPGAPGYVGGKIKNPSAECIAAFKDMWADKAPGFLERDAVAHIEHEGVYHHAMRAGHRYLESRNAIALTVVQENDDIANEIVLVWHLGKWSQMTVIKAFMMAVESGELVKVGKSKTSLDLDRYDSEEANYPMITKTVADGDIVGRVLNLFAAKYGDGSIGEQIKARRSALNLTQKELAGILQIPQARIAEYEAGKREPTVDILRSMGYVIGPVALTEPS